MEQLEKYLKPTPTIDCDNEAIREKAHDLIKNQRDTADKAKSLFYFVRDKIKYNMYVPFYLLEHYIASRTLQKGEGYCCQKAILMAALARAVGIPARLGYADIINYMLPKKFVEARKSNLIIYHGFAELFLNDRWVKVTPVFDLDMCQRHRFIPVDFDGKNDAKFHPINQDGKPHIEYVRERGSYEDIPLDEILNARKQGYEPRVYETWKETVLRRKPG